VAVETVAAVVVTEAAAEMAAEDARIATTKRRDNQPFRLIATRYGHC
jgi:hypothetical protein